MPTGGGGGEALLILRKSVLIVYEMSRETVTLAEGKGREHLSRLGEMSCVELVLTPRECSVSLRVTGGGIDRASGPLYQMIGRLESHSGSSRDLRSKEQRANDFPR